MTAVTEHVYTATERRKALADLAEDWDDTGEAVRELRLADLAHPSLPAWEIASAWAEYLDAWRFAAGLKDGSIGWQDWDEKMTGFEKPDRAYEAASMWAASVLDRLVNGGTSR